MTRSAQLRRVVNVRCLGGYRLEISFSNKVSGETDLHDLIIGKGGVMSPLADPAFFSQVRVNTEAGTIEWPNLVDFCPDVLYERVTSHPRAATAQTSRARP